jgi:hypothetical protein
MRKKKGSAVDSAALTSAWAKVFEGMVVDDLDAYLAQGWMTAECVANKTSVSLDGVRMRLKRMATAGELESKKIRIMIGSASRMIHIYHPKS